jgi:hypothetical protein
MVAFTGEQRLGFQLGSVILGAAELAVEFLEQVVALLGVGFFLREMNVGIEVVRKRNKFVVGGDLVFGALALAENALRGFLIAPEIGLCNAGFERLQAFAVGRGVKDSSEPWRCGA